MFSHIFRSRLRKQKPRVYLGDLLVASRNDLFTTSEEVEAGLRESLKAIISLPPIESRGTPKKGDLAFEMVVTRHQDGEFGFLSIPTSTSLIPLLFMWRPKVEVHARLYLIRNEKTVHSVSAKKKMPWKNFFNRVFSFRNLFSFKTLFDEKDMEILLSQASVEILQKLIKKL